MFLKRKEENDTIKNSVKHPSNITKKPLIQSYLTFQNFSKYNYHHQDQFAKMLKNSGHHNQSPEIEQPRSINQQKNRQNIDSKDHNHSSDSISSIEAQDLLPINSSQYAIQANYCSQGDNQWMKVLKSLNWSGVSSPKNEDLYYRGIDKINVSQKQKQRKSVQKDDMKLLKSKFIQENLLSTSLLNPVNDQQAQNNIQEQTKAEMKGTQTLQLSTYQLENSHEIKCEELFDKIKSLQNQCKELSNSLIYLKKKVSIQMTNKQLLQNQITTMQIQNDKILYDHLLQKCQYEKNIQRYYEQKIRNLESGYEQSIQDLIDRISDIQSKYDHLLCLNKDKQLNGAAPFESEQKLNISQESTNSKTDMYQNQLYIQLRQALLENDILEQKLRQKEEQIDNNCRKLCEVQIENKKLRKKVENQNCQVSYLQERIIKIQSQKQEVNRKYMNQLQTLQIVNNQLEQIKEQKLNLLHQISYASQNSVQKQKQFNNIIIQKQQAIQSLKSELKISHKNQEQSNFQSQLNLMVKSVMASYFQIYSFQGKQNKYKVLRALSQLRDNRNVQQYYLQLVRILQLSSIQISRTNHQKLIQQIKKLIQFKNKTVDYIKNLEQNNQVLSHQLFNIGNAAQNYNQLIHTLNSQIMSLKLAQLDQKWNIWGKKY